MLSLFSLSADYFWTAHAGRGWEKQRDAWKSAGELYIVAHITSLGQKASANAQTPNLSPKRDWKRKNLETWKKPSCSSLWLGENYKADKHLWGHCRSSSLGGKFPSPINWIENCLKGSFKWKFGPLSWGWHCEKAHAVRNRFVLWGAWICSVIVVVGSWPKMKTPNGPTSLH